MSRRPSPRLLALLIPLLAGGVFLRFYRLGALGWAWDEDITALAVQGVLEHGWPRLPSGRLYARALPYTYVTTLAALAGGVSEGVLRAVGVVFSLGSVVLTALLGRILGRPWAGLWAAGLAALSLWEVALARNARMYPMLSFLLLATVIAWHAGWVRRRRAARALACALLFVSVLTHDLAAVFVLLFAAPLAGIPGDAPDGPPASRRRWLAPLLAGLTAMTGLLVPRLLGLVVGERFATLEQRPGALQAAEGVAGLGRMLASFIRLPDVELWKLGGGVVLGTAMAILGLVLILSAWRRRPPPGGKGAWVDPLLDLVFLAALLLHQVVAALIVLFVSALRWRGAGGPPVWARLLPRCVAVALGAAAWAGLGLISGAGGIRSVALAMLDFPRRYWWLLAELFPVLFLLTVPLTVIRLLRSRPGTPLSLLSYLCLGGLAVLGLAASPSFASRYVSPLHPFLLLLAVLNLEALASTGAGGRPPAWRRLAVAALAVFLVLDVAPPGRLAHKLQQTYAHAMPEPLGGPWEGFTYYPDEKSTALYVRRHRLPGDRVIVMNWLSFASYAGPADAWLRTSGYEVQVYPTREGLRDVYTGALLLPDREALETYLATAESTGRVWLVTSGLEVDRGERVTTDILDFLGDKVGNKVYTAADGRGTVYLFDRSGGRAASRSRTPAGPPATRG